MKFQTGISGPLQTNIHSGDRTYALNLYYGCWLLFLKKSIKMGISLGQCRGAIGLFNCIKHERVHVSNQPLCFATLLSVFNWIALVILLVFILNNDIEINPGPMSPNLLNIGHCNRRGFRANFHDLLIHLTTAYDIFFISETMLSSRVRCDSLKIKGYHEPVPKDRTHHGGGLLIYISNSVISKRRLHLESSDIETLWVEIKNKGMKFFVCSWRHSGSK